MSIKLSILVMLGLCLCSELVAAQQDALPADGPAPTLCDDPKPELADYLPDVREAAIAVRRVYCLGGASRADVLNAFIAFVEELATSGWFDPFGGFANAANPMQAARNAINPANAALPAVGAGFGEELTVNGQPYAPASEDACSVAADGDPCGAVLDEFRDYYTHAQLTYTSEDAAAFVRGVGDLSREWDLFLDESRSQTPLELAINGAIFRRNETRSFSRPPDRQWIVLHPNIVLENVADALEGQKTTEAIMIELVGMNWWRREKPYVPTGASLVTVYADRGGVDDTGLGLALHFRGVYTIGFTKRDDSDGVFVSFDLFKLMQDKQNVLQKLGP